LSVGGEKASLSAASQDSDDDEETSMLVFNVEARMRAKAWDDVQK